MKVSFLEYTRYEFQAVHLWVDYKYVNNIKSKNLFF